MLGVSVVVCPVVVELRMDVSVVVCPIVVADVATEMVALPSVTAALPSPVTIMTPEYTLRMGVMRTQSHRHHGH